MSKDQQCLVDIFPPMSQNTDSEGDAQDYS